MDCVSIPAKRLDGAYPLPCYAYEGDAGMDLHTTENFTLAPFERKTVSCGIAIALPDGYAGLVLPRSGLAAKQGISIVNAPGLIDSNYRGEIKVPLINLDPKQQFEAQAGDRIAQLVVVKVANAKLEEQIELGETVRGSQGFGSSGIAAT